MIDTLQAKLDSDFLDGTLASAVEVLANDQTDPVALSVLLEAAARLRWSVAELARRDRNELRNCINWGPCSTNDGRMADGPACEARP